MHQVYLKAKYGPQYVLIFSKEFSMVKKQKMLTYFHLQSCMVHHSPKTFNSKIMNFWKEGNNILLVCRYGNIAILLKFFQTLYGSSFQLFTCKYEVIKVTFFGLLTILTIIILKILMFEYSLNSLQNLNLLNQVKLNLNLL